VRVFDSTGNVTAQWMAYDPNFSGGVTVSTGTLGLQPAIVTGAGPGGGPHVRVFDQNGAAQGGGFFAYDPGYAGGVNVAVGNNSIITGAGVPHFIQQVLGLGNSGSDVAALQQRLLDMSYWLPGIDGSFGASTQQAVWAFQKANGLPRDGKIGPEDLPALNSGARPAAASTSGDLVEVDKARQLLFEVRAGTVVSVTRVSTGATGNTPVGHWHVYAKGPGFNEKGMYDSLFFLRGFAIHGYASVPTYPASHGCVRTPLWFAPGIYSRWGVGASVYVFE
jgi:hypothetical protein